MLKAAKWGIQNTKGTTIKEIRSQIQEDLITYLDDIDKYNGGHIISEVCKIVSDNFNTLKKQNQNGKEKV